MSVIAVIAVVVLLALFALFALVHVRSLFVSKFRRTVKSTAKHLLRNNVVG